MSDSATTMPVTAVHTSTRWLQLLLGLICMMAISSPQYVWTLFTKPIGGALGVAPATLQVTFSLLIVLQTFFSPFQGYLVDRFGPRRLISLGTVAHPDCPCDARRLPRQFTQSSCFTSPTA